MPPPNGQDDGQDDGQDEEQVRIDTKSHRYGTVVAGSANFQGEKSEWSFRFQPKGSLDAKTDPIDLKGELVAEVVEFWGKDKFAGGLKVTLISSGGYSDPRMIEWIVPGHPGPYTA